MLTTSPILERLRALDPGFLLVGLLALLAISPLFPPGLPSIADAPIHLFRTMEMVTCWRDGVYYPRWAPHLAFGYGYPLFNFAPPLPYFIAGALHVLGFSLETSIKLLSALCLIGYGLGMYLFTRNVLGNRAALVAAAAFIYTPFRFWETLLYGGNYPQLLAIGLFPWVLWAMERASSEGRQRYILAGGLCYAALLLSHNFHALIFTPLLAGYVFVAARLRLSGSHRSPAAALRPGDRPELRPVMALLLGLALTAFFWAPAIHDMQYTLGQEEYYLTRSDFRLRLLSPRDLLALPVPLDKRLDNPYVPFSLGVAVLVLAILGILYALFALRDRSLSPAERQPDEQGREIGHLAFFTVTLLGACFLMLRPAAPLWEKLPFLPYAEFPWRLMGVANLAAAFLAGGSVRLWERLLPGSLAHPRLCHGLVGVSLVGLIGGVAVYLYPTRPFQHWGTPTLSDYIQYEVETQNLGTTGLAEYLPGWASEIPSSSPLVNLLRAGKPIEKLDRSALPAGVKATQVVHSATVDRYRFNSPTGFQARFFTFYFPGWRAFLDDTPVPIQPTPPLGLIAIEVPAGEHELLLRFGETPFRLAMDILAALGLLGLLGWLARNAATRKKKAHPQPRADAPLGGKPDARAGRVGPGAGYGILAMALVAILVAKLAWIDPHTTWFRRQSPPGQVIGMQYPMSIRLEDHVLFLGYDLISSDRLRPGQLLQVRLYWQATSRVNGDYVSFIHLDAPPDNTTFATADNYHPGDPQSQNDVPTLRWNPALYVRDEHRLTLPDGIPAIAYTLRAGMYERETGQRLPILPGQPQAGDTLALQPIHILSSERLRAPSFENERPYRLGASIELLGYNLGAEQVQPGQAITVTLFWRALEPVGNYVVFVHLLDAAGQICAQHDSPPLNGRYPTQNWLPRQIVKDPVTLSLPLELPAGEYRLVVGMYEPVSGQRLAVSSPDEDVRNDAIPIEPALQVKLPLP